MCRGKMMQRHKKKTATYKAKEGGPEQLLPYSS